MRCGSRCSSCAARPSATDRIDADPAAAPTPTAPPPPAPPPRRRVGASPQKLFDAALADYDAGQYDLAIIGFEAYIRDFPKSDMADDAQVLHRQLVSAATARTTRRSRRTTQSIRTYPTSNVDSRRLLQEGRRAREPEAARPRARGVGVRRQELSRQQRGEPANAGPDSV